MYFYVLMIRWYLNLVQNLKMFQNYLTILHVIILCDSWYTKQNLVCIVYEYPNLDLIDNTRINSVIYELTPAHINRRDRPAKGFLLKMPLTFQEKKQEASIQVSIWLLPEFSTTVKFFPMSLPPAKKLFFSIIFPEELKVLCAFKEKMHLTIP